MLKVRKEMTPIEIKTEVITNCWFKRMSPLKQAMRLGMIQDQIRNIIYEFKSLQRITKNVRKSINNKRQKFDSRHSQWLEAFVRNRGLNGFTCSDVRVKLLREFPELDRISLTSLNTILSQDLGLSYKKLGGTNIKKVRPESIANLTQCAKLMISLLHQQYYLVFVDEFTKNRRAQSTYGWTERGKLGRMLISAPDFKMSFIVSHSQVRAEGIMGTKSTFNQRKYKRFLNELISRLKVREGLDWNKLIIVADNCVLHRTSLIKRLFVTEKLKCLFIPPY